MDVKDRVAIVTGSASGIGRATAIALAQAGARGVVLADVQGLDAAVAAVEAAGAEALPVETDVSDLGSLRTLFDQTEKTFGRLDILHNNAGMGEGSGIWPDVDPARCAAIVGVNLTGVVLGTQLALDPMKRSGGGVVINTSSGGAFVPLPPQAVYAATKAGVVHFTRSCVPLAESHGVRVNCICPGLVDTPMILETGGGEVADWLRPVHDGVTLLSPEQIAEVVISLVRDDSKVAEIVTVENNPATA
ncbi:MAG: SDR family oxidoreductase [Myxococcota bacterium]|jgi:3-oxoacyl-[acyl-carrier protein] reductase|nr:SDR family oxidoreductase [Myxococcota bacterium]